MNSTNSTNSQKPENMTDDQLEAYINSMDEHTDQRILVHAVEVAERREYFRLYPSHDQELAGAAKKDEQ